jgi:cytochrome P450
MHNVITSDTDAFTSSAAYADTVTWHETVTPLRQQSPVVRVEGTPIGDIWAVLGHPELLEVERQNEQFTSGPACTASQAVAVDSPGYSPHAMKTLVEMDGEEHMAHRLVVNKWFLPASVRRLDDAIEARANEAITTMKTLGGSCDFASDIAVQYPLKVIMTLFGVPDEDFGVMLRLTEALMAAQDPDANEAASMAMLEFFEYFQQLAQSRRDNPTDDLASIIANADIDGEPVGDMGTFGLYLIVATAGHDTTSGALAGGMDALLANPEQLDALRDDPELMVNATDEIIRWVSPVKHFLRTAQSDYELAGAPIKAGDRLLLSYPSANRDERVFDDPFSFDVSRPNASEHIAFGFGRHYCLGVHLARLEVRKFYELLIPRLASIEASGPCVNLKSSMVSGPTSLPIEYTLR